MLSAAQSSLRDTLVLTGTACVFFLALAEWRYLRFWSQGIRRSVGAFIGFSLLLALIFPVLFFGAGLGAGAPVEPLLHRALKLVFSFVQLTLFGSIFLGAALSQSEGRHTPPLFAASAHNAGEWLFDVSLAVLGCLLWTGVWLYIAGHLFEAETSQELFERFNRESPLSRDIRLFALWIEILFIAPLLEEIIFRGFLMGQLLLFVPKHLRERPAAQWGAIFGVTLLFCVLHTGQIDPAWVKWIQIFGIGVLLGWIRFRQGLGAAVVVHLLFNLLGFVTVR